MVNSTKLKKDCSLFPENHFRRGITYDSCGYSKKLANATVTILMEIKIRKDLIMLFMLSRLVIHFYSNSLIVAIFVVMNYAKNPIIFFSTYETRYCWHELCLYLYLFTCYIHTVRVLYNTYMCYICYTHIGTIFILFYFIILRIVIVDCSKCFIK